MNTHTIRILNFYALDFSRIEYYDRIRDYASYMKTLKCTVGNGVIILDIPKKDYETLSAIQDDDIFYLYLINLINKNKKNVSN